MDSPSGRISIKSEAKRYYKLNREEFDGAKLLKRFFVCGLCGKEINGTREFNLAAHIKQKHPIDFKSINIQKPKCIQQKRLELLQHCVEIVTVNGRPFNALLDSGFQRIIEKKLLKLKNANMFPDLKHAGLSDVKNYIQHISSKIREIIKSEIKDRMLPLLIDIGTRNRCSFLGMNVQYFMATKLKRLHWHDQLGKINSAVITARMQEFNIRGIQLITVTTDNGSNVTKCVRDFDEENENFHENEEIVHEATHQFTESNGFEFL